MPITFLEYVKSNIQKGKVNKIPIKVGYLSMYDIVDIATLSHMDIILRPIGIYLGIEIKGKQSPFSSVSDALLYIYPYNENAKYNCILPTTNKKYSIEGVLLDIDDMMNKAKGNILPVINASTVTLYNQFKKYMKTAPIDQCKSIV